MPHVNLWSPHLCVCVYSCIYTHRGTYKHRHTQSTNKSTKSFLFNFMRISLSCFEQPPWCGKCLSSSVTDFAYCLLPRSQPGFSGYGAWRCACGPLIITSPQHGQQGISCCVSVLCCWHSVPVFGVRTQAPLAAGKTRLSSSSCCLKETLHSSQRRGGGWKGGVCLPTSSNTQHFGDASRTVLICSPQRQTPVAFLETLREECLSLMSGREIMQLCLWWESPVIYPLT